MRVNFRQGIVSAQDEFGGFLLINGTTVDLVAQDRPTRVTLAQGVRNYLHSEDTSITSAWTGISLTGKFWLYWDFDLTNFARTFGFTELEPVVQASEPTAGQVDSDAIPLLTEDRHWFNTTTNRHFVYTSGVWVEVLRVFATKLVDGVFLSPSSNAPSFYGTQIGNISPVFAGRVLFDISNNAVRRDDGTFFTTEDELFAGATRVDGIRLESNVDGAKFAGPGAAVAAYTVMAYRSDGTGVEVAQYDDTGSAVLGMLTTDLNIGEVGSIIIQGVITNSSWNWQNINAELWVNNGVLVEVDPHVSNVVQFPTAQVPIARVISRDKVVFEQGLGGIGETGPAGSVSNLPAARKISEIGALENPSDALGAVVLSERASPTDPNFPAVIIEEDAVIQGAPYAPLVHTQAATTVTYSPVMGGDVTATNVQDAIGQLDLGKLNLSGGTLTGFLTLNAAPTAVLHAATKGYVDDLVSGLDWILPVDYINLIRDDLTVAPSTPEDGDIYIIANPGPTGSAFPVGWGGLTAGDVVRWNSIGGSPALGEWEDLGHISTFSTGTRFGVTITSGTTAGGTFTAKNIYELTDPGSGSPYNSSWSLGPEMPPQLNQAFYVENSDTFYAFDQYVYNGTQWVKFSGPSSVMPYDVLAQAFGALSDSDIIFRFRATRTFTVSSSGHVGYAGTAPVGTGSPLTPAVFTIYKGEPGGSPSNSIGTIEFASGSNNSTNETISQTIFLPGDILIVEATTANSIEDVAITLQANIIPDR